MKNICVIGGGPAGMIAAYSAALNGHSVSLFEKNDKLGRKLYITGKGRCNITNDADISEFFDAVVTNSSFLYSAFYTFSNTQIIELLNSFGLQTKVERGGRVFPVSDKSSDVISALKKAMHSVNVNVKLNVVVQRLIIEDNRAVGIVADGKDMRFDSVIIATGGTSYPSTGSSGDGLDFAKSAGHTIKTPTASLVGLQTKEDVSALAGLTLKNVNLSLMQNNRNVYSQQGEMLFTHTGVSGPLALTASAYMDVGKAYTVLIDLKPALDEATLDKRLVRDFSERANQNFSNVLGGLLPGKLIDLVIAMTGIDADKKANSITKSERKLLLQTLKNLTLTINCKRPMKEAVITRGGVDVKEIDASTMQSKLCAGLYFAGEVIDVDALTGGYNLQIAYSTGFLAGAH
ncbi:MAG: NAD(P)/FAD-dependent oxidoreductase [Clostridia bacterium]|jgi:predicted Rossmann fold flavoprotein|nr:NAD(P)/FAD-dependent oxidoreductase [Clostridia bacterium]MBT7122102.1 NAD(P)/FAD-dependent oxidoreductase [Clostridia bacterium]